MRDGDDVGSRVQFFTNSKIRDVPTTATILVALVESRFVDELASREV